jgi:hypothetical protein
VHELGGHPYCQSGYVQVLEGKVGQPVNKRSPQACAREVATLAGHSRMQANHAELGLALPVAVPLPSSER